MQSLVTTIDRMMNIDRNEIIKASNAMNREAVQKIIDYLNTPENQDTEEQAADLAREVNKEWSASPLDLPAKTGRTGKPGRKFLH